MTIVSHTVKFWLYLIPLVPSMICSFIALYCLLFDRELRHGLHNHIPIFLLSIGLFCQLTIFPWMLYEFQQVETWQRSSIFCTIWAFIDSGAFSTQTLLFAWASVQRHILIFHEHWFERQSMRFIFHYLPLSGLIIYSFLFYLIIYFYPACSNIQNNAETVCVRSCLLTSETLIIYEILVHRVIPFLTMILFSLLLIVRIIWWKYHQYHANKWQHYRGLTIQVSCIVSTYLLFAFPCGIFNILLFTNTSLETLVYWNAYASFFNAYPVLLSPFVCLILEDRIRHRLMKLFPCKQHRRRAAVGPTSHMYTHQILPTVS